MTQLVESRTLLEALRKIVASGTPKTYSDAAQLLGRPPNNGVAVGALCNLLDAAACLAGIPALALVWIRSSDGELNAEAWVREYGNGAERDLIFQRSLQHTFTETDFLAIHAQLDHLESIGILSNAAAWKHIGIIFSSEELYLRLIGDRRDRGGNAIADLGNVVGDRALSTTWVYSRNAAVRSQVMGRANGLCEFCGQQGFLKPDGSRYLEAHHVIALANEGEDKITNVIALCADDHRRAHFAHNASALEQTMIDILSKFSRSHA